MTTSAILKLTAGLLCSLLISNALSADSFSKLAVGSRMRLGGVTNDAPNWTLASRSLGYEWTRPGGDYLDAKGVRNGPAHFAKASSLGNPPSSWDVTVLTQKLLADNTGFYLSMTKGETAPKFASRHSAQMPRLTVVTSAGTFNPPLAVACWVDASSNRCIGSESTDLHLGFPTMLKFDLSGITGTVTNAKLAVTYTNTFANPGGLELAVDFLDMPLLIFDPASQIGGIEGGIAATVARDSDLARHPAVLWYPTMDSEANIRAQWFVSPFYPGKKIGINPRFVDWPEYGLKAIRMESQSATNRFDGSSILTWRKYIAESTKQVPYAKAVGTQRYTELYVRYMLKIDPDVYEGMNDLGVKLPGFEGSGFSARMEHLAPSAANPHVYRLFIYWYGADNPFDNPNRGAIRYTATSVRAGQIYSIEQRIRQNTRSATGTWNADGAIEVWVDGVKVYSNTKALINNTVWPAEINNFFANFYHGGTATPKTAMHYEFSGVVLSTQYIGPAKKLRTSPSIATNVTLNSRR